jgi:hypothetical protein
LSLIDLTDPTVAAIALGVSIGLFAIGVLSIPIVIARLPADYFVRHEQPPSSPGVRHAVLKSLRNAFGVLLVLAGIAMLVLPGQGVLAILLGLSLIDFPGKRALLLRIVRHRPVKRVVNAIRRRAHKPPLELEDGAAAGSAVAKRSPVVPEADSDSV